MKTFRLIAFLSIFAVVAPRLEAGPTITGINFPPGPGFLEANFHGDYETGDERAYICYSSDGFNWIPLPGLEQYNPPKAGDGLRDVSLIKLGNNYIIVHSVSMNGGLEPYFGVVSSTDLIHWTHVADVTRAGWGYWVPRWFQDNDGRAYVLAETGFGHLVLTENTSKDGVTWATAVAPTYVGGAYFTGTDAQILRKGNTYYLFDNEQGHYHYATSSTLTSGYTDQGTVSAFTAGSEGLGITTGLDGKYYAYFHANGGDGPEMTCTSGNLATWTSPTTFNLPTSLPWSDWDNGTGIPVEIPSTDTPLFPPWGLSILAVLLFLAAAQFLPKENLFAQRTPSDTQRTCPICSWAFFSSRAPF